MSSFLYAASIKAAYPPFLGGHAARVLHIHQLAVRKDRNFITPTNGLGN
jgi:hypothetical protein